MNGMKKLGMGVFVVLAVAGLGMVWAPKESGALSYDSGYCEVRADGSVWECYTYYAKRWAFQWILGGPALGLPDGGGENVVCYQIE